MEAGSLLEESYRNNKFVSRCVRIVIWVEGLSSMVIWGAMKTTIEISDALLDEAKRTAAAEETSLRELVEEALRRMLSERRQRKDFRLRRASFKGRGLRPDVSEGNWEQLRDLAYQGRGS